MLKFKWGYVTLALKSLVLLDTMPGTKQMHLLIISFIKLRYSLTFNLKFVMMHNTVFYGTGLLETSYWFNDAPY